MEEITEERKRKGKDEASRKTGEQREEVEKKLTQTNGRYRIKHKIKVEKKEKGN